MIPQRPPKRMVNRGHGEWHDFDPRVQEYYDAKNHYTSGPGLHLPPSVPYIMRKNTFPYKLFVSGIHPHTTEEGIRYIFCNYGKPLSVVRTRNKLQQPIAFVEFESQCEADYAIIELNGKPPLNWEVCYAMTRCSEERIYPQFTDLSLESDFERQTPMFQISGTGGQCNHQRQSPGYTLNESPMEMAKPTSATSNLNKQDVPPCSLCGAQAPLVCTICKTRYCSQACQESDWPTHQPLCRPPPALEPANPNADLGNKMIKHRVAPGKAVAARLRDNPNIPFSRLGDGGFMAIEQNDGVSEKEAGKNHRAGSTNSTGPHSFSINGIHPLDEVESSNQHPANFSVTIFRNSTSGPRAVPRIVTDSSDASYVHGKSQSDGRNLQTTNQSKPMQSCARSPKVKDNDAPMQRYEKSSIFSSKRRETALSEHKYENHLEMGSVPKPSSLLVSPKSPVPSATRKSQITHTTNVEKVYATQFSSRRIPHLSDKPVKVSVSFAKSPSEFYIQYYPFREILEQLMRKITLSFANSDPLVNPIEGQPCLAIFPDDGYWYRAQVLKIMPDSIGVRYVDFGNTLKMPNSPETCRMMEYSLSEYPFYAIKVKLADVLPVKGTTWDRNVCHRFKEIVTNQTFLMECLQSDSDALSVRLNKQCGSDLVMQLLQENLVGKSQLQVSDELDRHHNAGGINAPSRPQQIVQKSQNSDLELPGFSGGNFAASVHVNSAQTPDRLQATPKKSLATPLTEPLRSPISIYSPTRAALRQEASCSQPRTPTRPTGSVCLISLPACPVSGTVSPTPLLLKANSIIEVLETGMTVIFKVIVLDDVNRFIGMLIRDEGDLSIIEFDSLAETTEPLPGFQPSVGSIVAAFSLVYNQWFRGCITKVGKSTYTVFYVDYGNVEEGVTSVKPIPSSYRHSTLSVGLSFVENSTLETKKYIDETMFLNSSHQLEVTAKDSVGSVMAKLKGENIPPCAVKLEPWTSLLPKLDATPVLIRNIVPPNWEAGFCCDVILIVAEDVNCIYVQAVTDEIVDLTCKIQKELNDYLPNSVPVPIAPVKGSYVAAIFPNDGELYRAQIIETTGKSYTVFYLDFGNTSTVSLGDIRVLPDRFYTYPACCKRVSLARVVRPPTPLPTDVQDLLSSCVNKIFNMLVLPSMSEFTECVLTEDGKVLNELIVDLFEQTNTIIRTCSPIQMPLLETASSDRDCTLEGDGPVDNTLSELSYDDGPFMELPEGKSFQAVISNVDGPQLIMLHEADDQISTKLIRLGEELEAFATTIVRGHGPKLNEICIARYNDGKWYRSACLDVIEDPAGRRYMCIQVDYGETHIVDVDDIRRIPRRLIDSLPYLAQHTILEGTESMEEVKPELVTRFGEILPKNRKVAASVVSRVDMAYVVRIPEVSAILSSEGLL